MPVLVPDSGFFPGQVANIILPPPMPSPLVVRGGRNYNVNEIIGPVNITAKSSLICPGGSLVPGPTPELIYGISIASGVGIPRSGNGCTVTLGPVPSIPEMVCPVFFEPFLVYKSIFLLVPVPKLTLPLAITGRISEKYFYDGDFGVSFLSKSNTDTDTVRGASFLDGKTLIKRPFPEGRIDFKKAPKVGSVTLNTVYSRTPAEGVTTHSALHEETAAGSSYLVSYRPSLIRRLRFFFVITVYTTCPPYTHRFNAYMDVDNNWSYHQKRVKYRVGKQLGAKP